ncbi:MAG: ABC transporter permease, partial [Candidatus Rokuibacteriota bacterium]
MSPLVVPVMVLAVSLYYVFGRIGLVGTLGGLVLAHALLGAPYVVLNVEAVMRAFDVRLERAARSLGATAWQAFRRVTLPLVRAGVLAGALFAFIASLDEVVVAMFLSGTSAITLPKLMWDSITQDELNPVVAAVASLQVAAAVAAFGASEVLR